MATDQLPPAWAPPGQQAQAPQARVQAQAPQARWAPPGAPAPAPTWSPPLPAAPSPAPSPAAVVVAEPRAEPQAPAPAEVGGPVPVYPCPWGHPAGVTDPNGVEPKIRIRNLTKAFGSRVILEDLTFDIPKGKVTVVLGPSGTGKSVFLRHLIGLLRPNSGELWVDDKNVPTLRTRELLQVRKKYGVLFQDGALFGSMTIFDNVAFPLREHTRKNEKEVKEIVMEKLQMVGMTDAAKLLPNEISGGMRKRAGLARGLVLDPEILLFDEPDSGLDPVRTAFLNELILDLKSKLDSTFVVVTHHIPTAKNIADNLAMLYRRNLMMAGPKEILLNSDMPVVRQFLRGSTMGPIGMSEEKDSTDATAQYEDGGFSLEDDRDDEALPGADRPQ